MVVTSLSNSRLKTFIKCLGQDYPDYKFTPGPQENWSPKSKTITYNPDQAPDRLRYGILHELAHAILDHTNYQSDFELLKLESEAWELAAKLGEKYRVKIGDEHIQNCLDTYRDWLDRRSTCPACDTHVLQAGSENYYCYNCQTTWHVSSGRFVRPYRRTLHKAKTA
jgi:hypothetical protein